jgi:hypothetical protein
VKMYALFSPPVSLLVMQIFLLFAKISSNEEVTHVGMRDLVNSFTGVLRHAPTFEVYFLF